jgi:two-component system, OmpR family, sensor kinase
MNNPIMTDDNPHHPSYRQEGAQDFFRQLDIQLLIHELKGPLSVIESNNRMLIEWPDRYGRLNEFQARALKRSMRCTAKLKNIIQGILEVGSSQTGCFRLGRFDVVHSTTEILVDVLETELCKPIGEPYGPEYDIGQQQYEYLSANGIFLEISPEVKGLVLNQDEAKFRHILANLVRNALQHKKSTVIVQMTLKKPNLEICVNDDGHGIAPEDQPKLFQCYTQIKTAHREVRVKGHGLGLACSRILARRIGGDITIDTLCRSGSRFILQLPLMCG